MMSLIEQLQELQLKNNILSYKMECFMSVLYKKGPKLLISHEQYLEQKRYTKLSKIVEGIIDKYMRGYYDKRTRS